MLLDKQLLVLLNASYLNEDILFIIHNIPQQMTIIRMRGLDLLLNFYNAVALK